MAARSPVHVWANHLKEVRRSKGAAYSEGMRSYVRTIATDKGPKKRRVNGITSYIANVASAARPDKTERTWAALEDDGEHDPIGFTQFRDPAESVLCHTECYRASTGRGHGSRVHNEISHWLSFMEGTRKRQKVWDPCFLALMQALAEDDAEIVFNEYVMTSDKYGTAADLIVSVGGRPTLVEIKCTRGTVDNNFSPYAQGMAHTGVLEGMPVNEYTTAQVQLLVMVLMLQDIGIPLIGKAGPPWEQRARHAVIYRVGKPVRETDNTQARDVLKFTLDERVWNRRFEIMTVFRTHANMTKKASKRTAKRNRRIAELSREFVDGGGPSRASKKQRALQTKKAASNARKRKSRLVNKDRPRIGRFKERDDSKGFDLRKQAARLRDALRAAKARRGC